MKKKDEIAEFIRNNIKNGTYKPGMRLMCEQDLCKKFNVARMTVRQGLDILVNEDLIYKITGSGSYVKDNKNKYIIISTNEAYFTQSVAEVYRNSVNILKKKIINLGYTPYLYLEKDSDSYSYSYTNKQDITLGLEIKLEEIVGLISIRGNEESYDNLAKNNIPIINLLKHDTKKYPGINLNNTDIYKVYDNLLEKYNLKDVIMFNYYPGDFLFETEFMVRNYIDSYFNKKYKLFNVKLYYKLEDQIKAIEECLNQIDHVPEAIVFLDDNLYKATYNVFTKYDNLFRNTKIITHSNNNELIQKNYKICRVIFDPNVFCEQCIKLLLKFINKENPIQINEAVQIRIENEGILQKN